MEACDELSDRIAEEIDRFGKFRRVEVIARSFLIVTSCILLLLVIVAFVPSAAKIGLKAAFWMTGIAWVIWAAIWAGSWATRSRALADLKSHGIVGVNEVSLDGWTSYLLDIRDNSGKVQTILFLPTNLKGNLAIVLTDLLYIPVEVRSFNREVTTTTQILTDAAGGLVQMVEVQLTYRVARNATPQLLFTRFGSQRGIQERFRDAFQRLLPGVVQGNGLNDTSTEHDLKLASEALRASLGGPDGFGEGISLLDIKSLVITGVSEPHRRSAKLRLPFRMRPSLTGPIPEPFLSGKIKNHTFMVWFRLISLRSNYLKFTEK